MAEKKAEYEIIITGNAVEKINKITGATEKMDVAAKKTSKTVSQISAAWLKVAAAVQVAKTAINAVNNLNLAYNAQLEAETKLGKVMQNTMGATKAQVESIMMLTSAQQRLGVVGDEVQLAGAQELATYLGKTKSLKSLIPVMNDMLAQQYGLNATQEQATQIASMLGKVMDGQVGALSRYGYKFDKTQEKILKFGTEEQRVATLTEVVTSAVGGMNERLAKTTAGRAKQLANSWGDLKEQLGGLGQTIGTSLIPVASKAVSVMQSWVEVPLDLSIAREKAELNALVGALIESSGKEDERKRIIDELQAKYPDFLKNIDLEKASNEELRKELEKVNKEYDKRMKKAALERRVQSLDEEMADVMDDITAYEVSIQAQKEQNESLKKIKAMLPKGYSVMPAFNGNLVISRQVSDEWSESVSKEWIEALDVKTKGELSKEMDSYKANEGLRTFWGNDKNRKKKAEKEYNELKRRRDIIKSSVEREFGSDDDATGTPQGNGTGTTSGTTTAGDRVKSAVTDISSGGQTLKNFIITINDGLVKEVNNHFNSSSDNPATASDFMQRLSDALQMVVNDVNYAAS